MSATATQVDKGRLMTARHAGTCAECGGTIEPNDPIYFRSPVNGGPRHKRCVEPGEQAIRPGEPAGRPADERDETRDARRRDDGGRLWSEGDAARWAHGDARDATRPGGWGPAADDAARRAIDELDAARRDARDATRDDTAAADGGRAARSEFARAGDRDTARKELGAVLDLVIEALEKIRRLLA